MFDDLEKENLIIKECNKFIEIILYSREFYNIMSNDTNFIFIYIRCITINEYKYLIYKII